MSEDIEVMFEDEVIEVDGPPEAYYRCPNGELKAYRTLGLAVTVPGAKQVAHLHQTVEEAIQKIRDELAGTSEGPRIIYWRKRPQFGFDHGIYEWCCRIGTYPVLPNEFWDSLMLVKKEGESVRIAEEKPMKLHDLLAALSNPDPEDSGAEEVLNMEVEFCTADRAGPLVLLCERRACVGGYWDRRGFG